MAQHLEKTKVYINNAEEEELKFSSTDEGNLTETDIFQTSSLAKLGMDGMHAHKNLHTFTSTYSIPASTTTLVSSDEPDAIFVNTQAASN